MVLVFNVVLFPQIEQLVVLCQLLVAMLAIIVHQVAVGVAHRQMVVGLLPEAEVLLNQRQPFFVFS